MKKGAYGVLLGLLLLLLCPMVVSAANPPVQSYSGGVWKFSKGDKFYMVKNKAIKGWAKIGGRTYCFKQGNGAMITGWKSYVGEDYYFAPDNGGAMVTGFYIASDGNHYYFKNTGAAARGTITIKKNGKTTYYYAHTMTHALARLQWTNKVGGRWYYFSGSGVRYSDWFKLSGKKYYCAAKTGKMKAGWHSISGKWYYFEAGGYVRTNAWIPTNNESQLWYVDAEGNVEHKVANSAVTTEYDELIMVGDSRFARMDEWYGLSNSRTYYIAKAGQGYTWLKNTAYPQIEERVISNTSAKNCKSTAIVLNLGVNDQKNIQNYLNFVNTNIVQLSQQYGCDIYYVSVNPIDKSKFLSAYNGRDRDWWPDNVATFNKQLKAGLDSRVKYIDTYNYLMTTYKKNINKLTVYDGLHYNEAGSQAIYKRILRMVRKK